MKVSTDLIEAWRAEPESEVNVLVHVEGCPAEYGEAMSTYGLTVVRVFRLTSTVAARGMATQVLDLLDREWVTKVELDQQITTMS